MAPTKPGAAHEHPAETGPCDSSIAANFNGTPIAAGNSLWFSAVMKVHGLNTESKTTINLTTSTITFTANDTPYSVAVPDSAVTFDPAATSASVSFDPIANRWNETVPVGLGGNFLLDGAVLPISTALPGGVKNVTWSGHFAASPTGPTVNWQWSAAVYSQFSADYNALGVKPVDDNKASQYQNSDHAGTPENFKSFVVGGAMGGGGSNYTGGLSGTASVTPCAVPAPVRLYVTNFVNSTITEYDQNGNQIIPSGSFSSLNGPVGIAYDSSNGNLYVTNVGNNSITVYDKDGNQITPSGAFPNLNFPNNITFDPSNGDLYVSSALDGNGQTCQSNCITVYDQNGNQITPSGSFPGLNGPNGSTFGSSSTHLYVGSVDNGFQADSTITEYDPSGNQITPTGTFPSLDGPFGIALDSTNGDLYATQYYDNAITEYDQNGNQVATSGTFQNLNGPDGIVFDSSNNYLYVTNNINSVMTVYDPNGNQVATSGNFPNLDGPNHLTIVP